jgi:hypothetical protein
MQGLQFRKIPDQVFPPITTTQNSNIYHKSSSAVNDLKMLTSSEGHGEQSEAPFSKDQDFRFAI